jgi:hypothetical protein
MRDYVVIFVDVTIRQYLGSRWPKTWECWRPDLVDPSSLPSYRHGSDLLCAFFMQRKKHLHEDEISKVIPKEHTALLFGLVYFGRID